MRLAHTQIQNHLTKEPIGPAKPAARPHALIMHIDTLMNQPKEIGRCQDLVQHTLDLVVIVGRHDAHDEAHRPDHAGTNVRPPGAVDDGTVAVVGVGCGEDEFAGVAVGWVGAGEVACERSREERWEVGVVLGMCISDENHFTYTKYVAKDRRGYRWYSPLCL